MLRLVPSPKVSEIPNRCGTFTITEVSNGWFLRPAADIAAYRVDHSGSHVFTTPEALADFFADRQSRRNDE